MLNHLNISKSKWAIFSPIVDFRLSLSLKTSRLSTRNSHPLGIPRRFQKLCFGDHEWLWTASLRRSSHGSPGELRGRHQSLWSEKYQKRLYSLPDTFWEKYMYIYIIIYIMYMYLFELLQSKITFWGCLEIQEIFESSICWPGYEPWKILLSHFMKF